MDIIELEYQSEHESSGRVSETVNPGNVIWPEVANGAFAARSESHNATHVAQRRNSGAE